MLKNNQPGFLKSICIIGMSLMILVTSCTQEDQVNVAKPDAALDSYYIFLEQASGVGRESIIYNESKQLFTVANDMIVSKATLDEYMAAQPASAEGRTEQRSHNILLSDAVSRNFKYYIQPSLTQGWRDAVIQAIAQWNGVGGSKLRLVQVGSQAEANINVFMGTYDAANWVARATLPSGNGTGILEINPRFNDMQSGQKLFAMAHEMGHNIGFWHTDQTTGSLIPGTPAADPNSVMNSYVLPWNGFTNYDLIAVRYLYPGSSAFSTTIQAEGFSAMSGIQTEACTDTNGGLNVGYIEAGDWMAYNGINIPATGTYRVEYRVASANGGGRLSLDLNGGSVILGTIDLPNTGGWQNWTTVSQNVNINAGTYNFGIYAQAGGWNINWFRITRI